MKKKIATDMKTKDIKIDAHGTCVVNSCHGNVAGVIF